MSDNDVYVVRLHPRGGYAVVHCGLDVADAVEVPYESDLFHSFAAAVSIASVRQEREPSVHGVRTGSEFLGRS